MDSSKKYLRDKNVIPFISFKDQPVHIVELVKDKEDTLTDKTGKVKEGISYLVKENGEIRKFFTGSVGLISKLADCEEGDKVKISLKSRKTEGGYQSYYDVDKIGGEPEEIIEENEE